MKIAMIHGQSHKGSTYHIGKILADKLNGELTEFFLPRDFGEFCVGCTTCLRCPHYEKLHPITEAMQQADVLILTSPVYVFHATGSMKAWLDHYAHRWIVHRPDETMFAKQAVCISTAAGGGMKTTNKDMADSLFFWGIGRIYKYGKAVMETSWERVDDKIKSAIDRETTKLAYKIQKRNDKVRPGIKTRAFFSIMRLVHKKGFLVADSQYWKEKGWLEKKRPWK